MILITSSSYICKVENNIETADNSTSFSLNVSIAAFTITGNNLEILLAQRNQGPFRDAWELLSSPIHHEESPDTTVLRKLEAATRRSIPITHLEQLATYGAPERDPRVRTISIAYLAVIPNFRKFKTTDLEINIEAISISEIKRGNIKFAFDHETIVNDAIQRIQSKLEYTNVATYFFEDSFTLSQLRNVYEATWDTSVTPGNFQRKILQQEGFLKPLGKKLSGDNKSGRPADLFVPGPEENLSPPLKRNKPSG